MSLEVMPALSSLRLELRTSGLGETHRLVYLGDCDWQEVVPGFPSQLAGFPFLLRKKHLLLRTSHQVNKAFTFLTLRRTPLWWSLLWHHPLLSQGRDTGLLGKDSCAYLLPSLLFSDCLSASRKTNLSLSKVTPLALLQRALSPWERMDRCRPDSTLTLHL